MTTANTLFAISPIDGRYAAKTHSLQKYFSEYALIKYRIVVETEYLIELSRQRGLGIRGFTDEEDRLLRSLQYLSHGDAKLVKTIETGGYPGISSATNHDVKAVEMYLRYRLKDTSLADVLEWIHIFLTSEDVNNIAYALMLRIAIADVIAPSVDQVLKTMLSLVRQYRELPMLSRTHGQSATPTTLGKELHVFVARIERQLNALRNYNISVKLNGASGNYNSFVSAYPDIDWTDFTTRFVESFNTKQGEPFEVNLVTTQIEPHDTYAELFHILSRLNTVCIDFCQDIWRYISDDWLVQKAVEGETGSSTMPHKVNPIDWENAEGNFGIANALCEFFARKLPISRLQRDLSDSTVERNFGVVFAHSLIGYQSMAKGLSKISANEAKIVQALNDHSEVVTEAIQTILRREGFADAYGALKSFSRGKPLDMDGIRTFIRSLEVPLSVKHELLAITPTNYVGLATQLTHE